MIVFSSFQRYKTVPITKCLPFSIVPNPVKGWGFGYYEKLFPTEELIRSINFGLLDSSQFSGLYKKSTLDILDVHETILDIYGYTKLGDYTAIILVDYGQQHKVCPTREVYDWVTEAGYAVTVW